MQVNITPEQAKILVWGMELLRKYLQERIINPRFFPRESCQQDYEEAGKLMRILFPIATSKE